MEPRLSLNVSAHQVLPRSAVGTALVSADAPERQVQLVVTSHESSWEAEGIGSVRVALPVGGPYRIDATSRDDLGAPSERRTASDVHVGDVWVLAGQSNMQGTAPLQGDPPLLDGVRLLGFDGRWQPAREPLHRLYARRDHPLTAILLAVEERNESGAAQRWTEHHGHDAQTPIGGLGPGSVFARELAAASGVPIGLLPCALGGSTLDMWSPEWGADFGVPRDGCLFAHLVDQVRRHGPVRGVLWYQGEGDALAGTHSSYGARFEAFVESVRSAVAQPDLPFLTVQLASCDFPEFEATFGHDGAAMAVAWTAVRDHQRLAAQQPGVDLVAAADCGRFDAVHLDADGAERVGRRLARLAAAHTPGHPGPPGATVALRGISQVDALRIRCSFDGVTGRLHLNGPCVFRVEVADQPGPNVVRVDLDGPDAVLLELDAPLVDGAELLTYGSPWEIGCGLVDDLDMAVPAFGPVQIRATIC